MDRREALKHVTLILGGTIIGAQAFLSGCGTDKSDEDEKVSFSKEDMALVDEIGETIIPTTDTPGAKAVGVGSFMSMILPVCYEEKNQKAVHIGLRKIRNDFEAEFGHTFMEATPAERHSFLSKLDQEMVAYSGSKEEKEPDHYFQLLKEITLLAYFTSEVGCTQARRYVQTPGRYEGCIPYTEGDRAWI